MKRNWMWTTVGAAVFTAVTVTFATRYTSRHSAAAALVLESPPAIALYERPPSEPLPELVAEPLETIFLETARLPESRQTDEPPSLPPMAEAEPMPLRMPYADEDTPATPTAVEEPQEPVVDPDENEDPHRHHPPVCPHHGGCPSGLMPNRYFPRMPSYPLTPARPVKREDPSEEQEPVRPMPPETGLSRPF